MSAYVDQTVLHLAIVTKWSTVRSTLADTNYCSANLKYAEGYAEDMRWTYIHRGLPWRPQWHSGKARIHSVPIPIASTVESLVQSPLDAIVIFLFTSLWKFYFIYSQYLLDTQVKLCWVIYTSPLWHLQQKVLLSYLEVVLRWSKICLNFGYLNFVIWCNNNGNIPKTMWVCYNSYNRQ